MLTGHQVSALICQVLQSGGWGIGGVRDREITYIYVLVSFHLKKLLIGSC